MEKTDVSSVQGLSGLFYTPSLEKKDVNCFERIYVIFINKESGKGKVEKVLG